MPITIRVGTDIVTAYLIAYFWLIPSKIIKAKIAPIKEQPPVSNARNPIKPKIIEFAQFGRLFLFELIRELVTIRRTPKRAMQTPSPNIVLLCDVLLKSIYTLPYFPAGIA